jgi:hypothetical protein
MPLCDECESHVTPAFHRVFADNDDTLHGCPECMGLTEILNGEATGQ